MLIDIILKLPELLVEGRLGPGKENELGPAPPDDELEPAAPPPPPAIATFT